MQWGRDGLGVGLSGAGMLALCQYLPDDGIQVAWGANLFRAGPVSIVAFGLAVALCRWRRSGAPTRAGGSHTTPR